MEQSRTSPLMPKGATYIKMAGQHNVNQPFTVKYRNVSSGRTGWIGTYPVSFLQLPAGEYELTVTHNELVTAKTVSDTRQGTRHDYTFGDDSVAVLSVTLKAEQVYDIDVVEKESKAFVVVSRLAKTPEVQSDGEIRIYKDNRENVPFFRATLCDPCLENE